MASARASLGRVLPPAGDAPDLRRDADLDTGVARRGHHRDRCRRNGVHVHLRTLRAVRGSRRGPSQPEVDGRLRRVRVLPRHLRLGLRDVPRVAARHLRHPQRIRPVVLLSVRDLDHRRAPPRDARDGALDPADGTLHGHHRLQRGVRLAGREGRRRLAHAVLGVRRTRHRLGARARPRPPRHNPACKRSRHAHNLQTLSLGSIPGVSQTSLRASARGRTRHDDLRRHRIQDMDAESS